MTATANDAGRIVASGLTKTFGAVRAVSDLSFTVEPGSVTGFQRSGQDDHAADDPGPGDIDVGRGDGERAPIRRSARSRQDRGCGPRGHQLPPGPHRLWSFNSPNRDASSLLDVYRTTVLKEELVELAREMGSTFDAVRMKRDRALIRLRPHAA